ATRARPAALPRTADLARGLLRQRRCCYLPRFASTESLACLAIRNFSTRFAGIEIGWPVAGFRPMRAFRSTTTSFPTPGMVKPLRASLYASDASSSRNCPTCFLVRPVFSDSRFMVSDFEIPATYPSRAAYGLVGSRRILHERTRAHDATVSLRVVDEPTDRPAWVAEAVRLILRTTREERQLLLDRVARATD